MPDLCSQCSGLLSGQAEEAICPSCLLGGMDEAPPAKDLAAVFPDLTIERLLGRGGVGCVYEASQSPLNRRVAVKILPLEGRPDRAEVEERFLREGQALARLDHPNIVRVHQSGEAGGWLYLVMEFIAGADLAKRLAAGPLPWREAVDLAEQLCAGLEAAHSLGIVHRDIKPGNLLLTETSGLKIADFGLAKVVRGAASSWTLTRADSTMGTPFYMAPEQRRPGQAVEARADLYSAGVVLYEMLTGQLPMGHYRPASQLAGSPPALDAVLEKALATSPEERWPSAGAMAQALASVRLRHGSGHRFPWLRVFAGGAAALLAAAAAVFWWPPPAPEHGPLANPFPLTSPAASPDRTVRISVAEGHRLTTPQAGGLFGTMAVSGKDLLVVNRPGQDHFGEVSTCPGEVYVYPIDAGGRPGPPVILQAAEPQQGDLFGFVIDLDPDAQVVAVTTPYARPPGAPEEDDRRGSVDLFRRQPGPELRFLREQTIWLDRTFTDNKVQIRAFLGKGLLAICSPGLEPSGELRLFRERAGQWILEASLRSTQVKGAANFGWYADPDEEGRLLVSAYRHTEGTKLLHGAVVPFVRQADGSWEERPLLRDPEGNALALSGMSMVKSENRLLVSAPGDRRDGLLGVGSIAVYQRGNPESDWTFERKLVMPQARVTQAGFGQRLAALAGFAAVSVVQGELKKDGRNAVLFMWDYPEKQPVITARIEAREDGELWLGRIVLTDRLFAICHPRETNPAGQPNSGSVYVFPRAHFPVLYAAP